VVVDIKSNPRKMQLKCNGFMINLAAADIKKNKKNNKELLELEINI